MKHFYLLFFLLLSCKFPVNSETSKIAIVYNKKMLNNGDVIYMDKPIKLQLVFSNGQSYNLHPKIYKIGGVYYDFTKRSIKEQNPDKLRVNISYEWEVKLKSKEAEILFIFYNKHKVGDIKLIHFKQTKL